MKSNTMQDLMATYKTFFKSLSDSKIESINGCYKSIYAHRQEDGVEFYVVDNGFNNQSDLRIFDSEGGLGYIFPAAQFRQQLLDDAEMHLQELAYA